MSGETNLAAMLATLTVSRRVGTFVFATVPEAAAGADGEGVHATIVETEGTTLVAEIEAARLHGWAFEIELAWLTLDVHSSLEAVGLTAAVSVGLAQHDIPCNVLAGFYHDHLLVPVDRADDAVRVLEALATDA